MRLKREFYRQDSYSLAKALIGKVLCFQNQKYRIIETEAYGGITDKAAHSYNNNRTKRTETMYLDGGHVYTYLIYGMYYMFNIVASVKENPEAVLIRSLEPLNQVFDKKPTNGPGKLCKFLGIKKEHDGLDLCESEEMYIEDDGYIVDDLVCTTRVGIDYAEEDKDRLWRFYIKDHPYISKK